MKVVAFYWWTIKDYANAGKIVDAVYVGPSTVASSGPTPPP